MDSNARERLRLALTSTPARLPRQLKRDLGEPVSPRRDVAHSAVVAKLVDEIDDRFELTEKERPYQGWGLPPT